MDRPETYPGEAKYEELLRAFGYTDPAFFPKLFYKEGDAWTPVL